MISRRFLAWWAGLLALLGGCTLMMGGVGCSGIYVPPQHPSIRLTGAQLLNAQAASGGAIRSGEELEVEARTNISSPECRVEFSTHVETSNIHYVDAPMPLPPSDEIELRLRDDGKGGDKQAGDGVWYGRCPVIAREDCSVQAFVQLSFTRRFGGQVYSPQGLALPDIKLEVGGKPFNVNTLYGVDRR